MRKFINIIPDNRSKLKIAKELNFNDIEQQLMDGFFNHSSKEKYAPGSNKVTRLM